MDNSGNRPGDRASDSPNELPVIVRRSELLNLMVMDRGTMQEVGRVERLWMYPQAHRVLGVICKGGGLLGKKRWAYKLPQIESLTQGNIWIEGPGNETSPEQLRQLQTLIDHELWVDGGDRLGVIVDCLFNRKTGQITQYLFVNNRLRRLIDASDPLRPEEILSFGNQRALVSPKAVARLRRERPNLRQTFSQMKEQAKAEYEQVTHQTQERVRNWGEEAKTAKERLAEQAAVLKQQAAERAKALQEQAAQEILPQITEQAQELSQRVGEQYHTVQRRAQDFVEELPPLEQLGEEMRGDGPAYEGDYRQSRRSRYRRDQRSDERPGEYLSDRTPQPQQPYWDNHEPDETTWVDEVEDSPVARPVQARTDSPVPYSQAPRSDRDEPGDAYASSPSDRYDAYPSEPAPEPAPSLPISEAPASRDNPWGYADSATESDWNDLGLAQEEPAASADDESIPSEQEALPVVAPEDLEDNDPWI